MFGERPLQLLIWVVRIRQQLIVIPLYLVPPVAPNADIVGRLAPRRHIRGLIIVYLVSMGLALEVRRVYTRFLQVELYLKALVIIMFLGSAAVLQRIMVGG